MNMPKPDRRILMSHATHQAQHLMERSSSVTDGTNHLFGRADQLFGLLRSRFDNQIYRLHQQVSSLLEILTRSGSGDFLAGGLPGRFGSLGGFLLGSPGCCTCRLGRPELHIRDQSFRYLNSLLSQRRLDFLRSGARVSGKVFADLCGFAASFFSCLFFWP